MSVIVSEQIQFNAMCVHTRKAFLISFPTVLLFLLKSLSIAQGKSKAN